MKRICIIVTLVLAMLCASPAYAEERDLYIDSDIQSIFTSEDGLLSTSTQAVAQTTDGFIWIGGYGGLVRYDGKHFETFAYKRITRVSDLAAGEDGVLWVATSDKGLFRYEANEFEVVEGSDKVGVECLAFSPDKRLYLGTDNGLYTVEDGAIEPVHVPGLDGESIDRLVALAPNKLLCVTGDATLCLWDGSTLTWAGAGKDQSIRSACVNPAGGYLAGTAGNEVLALDEGLKVTGKRAMGELSCINDLRCDEGGVLWLCADNGIAIYVDGSVRMQNLKMNNSVDKMLIDQEGNHWFVSSRQGVLEVSRSKFGDVSQCAGLDPMVVNAIQRIDDTLYIGHDTGLVTIDATDLKRIETKPLDALENTRVRALRTDSRGDLWIGTMKRGLFRYTPGGKTTSFSMDNCPELLSDNVRSIQETDAGMLFGTDCGAYLVDDDKVSNVLDDPSAMDFRILCAAKFGDTLYLGSDGNGMYLVRDGQIVRRIATEDGLSSNVIMKAYWSDAYDGAWLVTGNNIDFLSSDGSITSIENFPSTNNLDLLVMDNGDAWVFTGSGIYLTTEESLLTDENPEAVQFRHTDGLPYEVTPNSYQCITDGLMYACGTGGVFSLKTDFSQAESSACQLAIDSVQMDGDEVYVRPGDVCKVGADVQRLAINAYTLTYQTGNPLVFYYLEGFDKDETVMRLSEMGDITYTNLDGGNYTFHYGVRDYRTGETLNEITLRIKKSYPWYQSPGVMVAEAVLGVVLLAAATLLVIQVRSRRIERSLQKEFEQKERTHLKKIAYKDYLTGLNNRNYLDIWNAQELQEDDFPVCYVSIDMNNLKKINDRYGHKHGDRLLCEMSDLLKRHMAGEQFALMRIGGDEFLVLSRGVAEKDVRELVDRMAADGETREVDCVPVTFAYGICVQEPDEFDFEEGLRLSDLRMLEAKSRYHARDSR